MSFGFAGRRKKRLGGASEGGVDALADAVLDVPSKDDFGRRFNSKIQHIALPALRVKNHTSIIVVLLKKVKRLDKI